MKKNTKTAAPKKIKVVKIASKVRTGITAGPNETHTTKPSQP